MSYITIADMFIQSIEKYADNPAFFDKINGKWQGKTYKEAGEIVENLASGLASLGVQKEDKIAILSTNTSKWAYADYAITGLGAVTVTVYPTLTNPQINYIFDDSETHYAFVENKDQLSKTRSLLQKCEHMKAYILMDDSVTDEDDVINFSQLLVLFVLHYKVLNIIKFICVIYIHNRRNKKYILKCQNNIFLV